MKQETKSLKLIIRETDKLSGKYIASFTTDHGEFILTFDLDDWKESYTNGTYGGDYIKLFYPTDIVLMLDREYVFSTDEEIEHGRLVYMCLEINGWNRKI